MGADGEAWIFYGHDEIEGLWKTYFPLGPQVSVVPIARPGNNSLDFHLVLHLGGLIAKRPPGTRFVIVSADSDYDAAIDHARLDGVDIVRIAELGAPPEPSSARLTASGPAFDRHAPLGGGRPLHGRPQALHRHTPSAHRLAPRSGGLARRC